MATIEPRPKIWTRDEYHRTADAGLFVGDRVELIRGEILTMSPMNPGHATAVQLVSAALREAVSGQYSIRVQLPMVIGDHSEPEPDIAIVSGQPRDFVDNHPTTASLVVEISDATLLFDRTQKKDLYASALVPEYWMLNLVDRCLEVFAELKDGRYNQHEVKFAQDEVHVPLPPSHVVSVSQLLP